MQCGVLEEKKGFSCGMTDDIQIKSVIQLLVALHRINLLVFMTVPDYIRCSHQGTLLKLGWPNSLHWPLRALGPQKSYANEKKYWELLQRPHKYIKDRSSKQKHFHKIKQGPGIYYSPNSKWCFFSSTPTLHSVILSFPQYGKITTSPTGFY